MAGRRRRHAAEQRRIEQQRWGQYVEEEDEGYSVVLPSPPNSRRRARRSSRRNCAQDDLQECLNELENDDYVTGLDDNLDLHLALGNHLGIFPGNTADCLASRFCSLSDALPLLLVRKV